MIGGVVASGGPRRDGGPGASAPGVIAFVPKLVRLLGRSGPRTFVFAATCGVLTGVTSAAAIATIHRVLRRATPPSLEELAWFVAFCVSIPLMRTAAHRLILKRSLHAMMEFVVDLTARIVATPLERLEHIGSHRIMSALTEDIATLNLAVTSLPTLLTNCTLVLACAAYLAWLEPMASLLFLAITATAMWTTLGVVRRSRDSQRQARTQVDALFGHFRDHLHGIKELQLNAGRRRLLGADLQHTASAYARQQVSASSAMSTAVGVFQVVFMLPVGALVFTAAWSSVEATAQVGEYVIVLLYAMAPVNAVGGLFQNLGRGAVAFGNIESLDLAFGERAAEPAAAPVAQRPWRRLIVRGAVHCFRSENGQASFTLGPVDLTFDRGDVVFLVGGNGSGKTTFTKMLCGLYLPESGLVAFDDEVYDPARLEAHRREFGAVYGDYHLFAHLPESAGEVEIEAGRYLRELGLAHKVTVSGARFSTLNLSQGERKRLALVASLLEDRNVYIFDEWAADQDPVSRAYFYEVILAALRQRGKTVFVVSHDERYFHVADRIVKFELGQVVAAYVRPAAGRAVTRA